MQVDQFDCKFEYRVLHTIRQRTLEMDTTRIWGQLKDYVIRPRDENIDNVCKVDKF